MYAIPSKLKEFRKAKGLTQKQVAEIIHIEQTTYSKIELAKSKLYIETALQIALIIEKDITDFTTLPQIANKKSTSKINNSINDNFSNNITDPPKKIINKLEELLIELKEYFNAK